MKEERTEYFSDKELEAFLAEIEAAPQIAAPEYLADMIMRKAERQSVRDSVEIVPIRSAIRESIREGKPSGMPAASKQKQFFVYSIRTVLAMAAAIALLILIPPLERSAQNQMEAHQIQYEQENQSNQKTEKEEKSILEHLNEKSSDMFGKLLENTNQLFHREDK